MAIRSVGQMKKRNYVLLINLLALFLLDTLKAKLNIFSGQWRV